MTSAREFDSSGPIDILISQIHSLPHYSPYTNLPAGHARKDLGSNLARSDLSAGILPLVSLLLSHQPTSVCVLLRQEVNM